jgi:hypothetical protein
MNKPVYALAIQSLGRFSISVDGKTVATNWPGESLKVFFCSLLSPLDLYFTWDRICRSLLGVPETRSSRRQLEELFIRPLHHFLIKEVGFNPLIIGPEGIRIDPQGIHLDVFEFYRAVVDGLNLVSLDDLGGARKKFSRANLLYAGGYLPGMPGKIIEHTRMELESLYKAAVRDGIWQTRLAPSMIDTVRPDRDNFQKTAQFGGKEAFASLSGETS